MRTASKQPRFPSGSLRGIHLARHRLNGKNAEAIRGLDNLKLTPSSVRQTRQSRFRSARPRSTFPSPSANPVHSARPAPPPAGAPSPFIRRKPCCKHSGLDNTTRTGALSSRNTRPASIPSPAGRQSRSHRRNSHDTGLPRVIISRLRIFDASRSRDPPRRLRNPGAPRRRRHG